MARAGLYSIGSRRGSRAEFAESRGTKYWGGNAGKIFRVEMYFDFSSLCVFAQSAACIAYEMGFFFLA